MKNHETRQKVGLAFEAFIVLGAIHLVAPLVMYSSGLFA